MRQPYSPFKACMGSRNSGSITTELIVNVAIMLVLAVGIISAYQAAPKLISMVIIISLLVGAGFFLRQLNPAKSLSRAMAVA
jgi:hypothetical protein